MISGSGEGQRRGVRQRRKGGLGGADPVPVGSGGGGGGGRSEDVWRDLIGREAAADMSDQPEELSGGGEGKWLGFLREILEGEGIFIGRGS